MITTGVFVAAMVFVLVLTFLSIFEMSLGRTSKVAVRRLIERSESKPIERLKQLVDNRVESLIGVYVGIQVCTASIAIISTAYLHSRFENYVKTLSAAFGLMFLVAVVFRQLIPRVFTFKNPERVALALLPVYHIIKPVLTVLAYPLSSTLRLFRQFSPPESSHKTDEHLEEEIRAFIDVGQEEGILKQEEGEWIQSVVEFGEKVAGDIMTPRTDMVTIDVTASPETLKKLMTSSKYSRLPVYREHVENIQGFVYLKDLIDVWDDPKGMDNLESLVRPIQFVPDQKRVTELLSELQRKASHMAVVIDEHGGVAGLVTIEDILEEIAGEIHDEDEASEIVELSKDPSGCYVIPGNTPIHDVEELFGIKLNDEETSTIAGFISSVFGRVPRKGEKYETQGVQFEVKEADRRKIHKVVARQLVAASSAGESEGIQAQ